MANHKSALWSRCRRLAALAGIQIGFGHDPSGSIARMEAQLDEYFAVEGIYPHGREADIARGCLEKVISKYYRRTAAELDAQILSR
jgi:hypothetical protein